MSTRLLLNLLAIAIVAGSTIYVASKGLWPLASRESNPELRTRAAFRSAFVALGTALVVLMLILLVSARKAGVAVFPTPADSLRSLEQQVAISQQTIQRQADSLCMIRAELTSKGTPSPGSPVLVTVHLPYRAQLSYRAYMSPDVVVSLGDFDPGSFCLQLPHGGYYYFEAKNLSTGLATEVPGDCRQLSGCTVKF